MSKRKKLDRLADRIVELTAEVDALIGRLATAHPVLCPCPHCTSHRMSGHRVL